MHYQLLINGVLNDGASKLDVVNPATEQVFATAARADGTLLNEAVTAASRAFPAWSRTSAEGRREDSALGQVIEQNAEEFARLLTMGARQADHLGTSGGDSGRGMFKFFAWMNVSDVVLQGRPAARSSNSAGPSAWSPPSRHGTTRCTSWR